MEVLVTDLDWFPHDRPTSHLIQEADRVCEYDRFLVKSCWQVVSSLLHFSCFIVLSLKIRRI